MRQEIAELRGIIEGLRRAGKRQAGPFSKGPPQAQVSLRQTLRHWRIDGDLAGICDPDALAKLPDGEQTAWRALWDDVDALRKKASADSH